MAPALTPRLVCAARSATDISLRCDVFCSLSRDQGRPVFTGAKGEEARTPPTLPYPPSSTHLPTYPHPPTHKMTQSTPRFPPPTAGVAQAAVGRAGGRDAREPGKQPAGRDGTQPFFLSFALLFSRVFGACCRVSVFPDSVCLLREGGFVSLHPGCFTPTRQKRPTHRTHTHPYPHPHPQVEWARDLLPPFDPRTGPCADKSDACSGWAGSGECEKNPGALWVGGGGYPVGVPTPRVPNDTHMHPCAVWDVGGGGESFLGCDTRCACFPASHLRLQFRGATAAAATAPVCTYPNHSPIITQSLQIISCFPGFMKNECKTSCPQFCEKTAGADGKKAPAPLVKAKVTDARTGKARVVRWGGRWLTLCFVHLLSSSRGH